MFKKGFTLIELLVVVGIIGILASLVLLNTQKVRLQAHDSQIQSSMHQLRNAAELSYSENEDYDDVCDGGDNTVNNAGLFGRIETDIEDDNGSQNVLCYEGADKKDFAASSPLRYRTGKHWCIESAGLSLEINNPITLSRCQ